MQIDESERFGYNTTTLPKGDERHGGSTTARSYVDGL